MIDFDMVNQYLCVTNNMLHAQRDNFINPLRKENLNSGRMRDLMQMVKWRKNMVTKAMFNEMYGGVFQYFKMVTEISRIEMYLWQYHLHTNTFSDATICVRNQFVMCLCGMLRSESIYIAYISDLCDFVIDTDTNTDPSPYHIIIRRVCEGNAN